MLPRRVHILVADYCEGADAKDGYHFPSHPGYTARLGSALSYRGCVFDDSIIV